LGKTRVLAARDWASGLDGKIPSGLMKIGSEQAIFSGSLHPTFVPDGRHDLNIRVSLVQSFAA
jgi:hypothetical protein